MDIRPLHKNQILEIHITQSQCGRTCGAIDEPSRSSKAIDKHLIINFRYKNVVIGRFRDKNVIIAGFRNKTDLFLIFMTKCHDMP